jgi:aminomethyltransferase
VSGASSPEPVLSPLDAVHERLGARFTEYAGVRLPLSYEGILSEHAAVRSAAGVFDVSHLGRLSVSGPGATDALRWLLCNDVADLPPGSAQYTMMLTYEGGVADDLLVWRWDEAHYWVFPNGVNHHRVMAEMRAAPEVAVSDLRPSTSLIAVQGPEAPGLVESVIGAAPGRFELLEGAFAGSAVHAAGTGYTGERGAELAVAGDAAPALFDAFVEAGATPCGLGARDVLRLEMGYPLWGQDLDTSTTPIEADLEWVVAWDHDFVGRRALAAQRRVGPPKRRICFATDGRSVPRRGYPLRCGPATGFVASGTFSPVLAVGIGSAHVSPDPGKARDVTVDIRGHRVDGTRVDPPFTEH